MAAGGGGGSVTRVGMGFDGDPLLGFNFEVEVVDFPTGSGSLVGYFTEFSGIGSENPAVDYKTVQDGKEIMYKLPGRIEWGEVTLKRGVTGNTDFWEWRELVLQGEIDTARCSMNVYMYDRAYANTLMWTLHNAWPSKITGANLSADSNDFAVEEISIQHEGMFLTNADGTSGMPTVSPVTLATDGNMGTDVPAGGGGTA